MLAHGSVPLQRPSQKPFLRFPILNAERNQPCRSVHMCERFCYLSITTGQVITAVHRS